MQNWGIPWWSRGQDSMHPVPGPDSVPGWGTKILQAIGWPKREKKSSITRKKYVSHSYFLLLCLRRITLPEIILCVCHVQSLSHVQLLTTPWTVVGQALLSVGFSRQKYWSGFAISSSRGIFIDPGIAFQSPVSPALAGDSLPPSHLGSPSFYVYI